MRHITRKQSVIALCVLLVGGVFIFAKVHGTSPRVAVIRATQKARLVLTRMPAADILLPIKFDRQDHALSCEVAALKMALAYYGIAVGESELIAKVGTDPVQKQTVGGQVVWGNPQKAFVGDINGKMPATGYGVYWEPIKRVAADYRPARSFSGLTAVELAQELQQGNPVIIWSYLGSGKPFSWQTPDKEFIPAVYYEHTFLVNGVKGSVEKPEGFFLIDPVYGQRYWPIATFNKRWGAFGNSGVIIY